MIATGYGLFIKSYMRYVKNRHMVALLTSNQIELHLTGIGKCKGFSPMLNSITI